MLDRLVTFSDALKWFDKESAKLDNTCPGGGLGFKGAGRLWCLTEAHNVGLGRIELNVYRSQVSAAQIQRRKGVEWVVLQLTRPPDRTWFIRVIS